MTDQQTEFQRVPIRPVDCLSEGWNLLSGQYWVFLAITLVGILIQSFVPFNILTGPMMCGIFIAWFAIARGEKIGFELLFKGFDFFLPGLVVSLIIVAVLLVAMVPSYILLFAGIALGAAAGEESPEVVAAATLLATSIFALVILTVLTIVMTLAFFAYQLIVDRKLGGIAALKTSAAAAWANIWGVLGLLGLTSIIVTIASLACIIPMFFVAPWCFAAAGVAYRRVFPEMPALPAEQ